MQYFTTTDTYNKDNPNKNEIQLQQMTELTTECELPLLAAATCKVSMATQRTMLQQCWERARFLPLPCSTSCCPACCLLPCRNKCTCCTCGLPRPSADSIPCRYGSDIAYFWFDHHMGNSQWDPIDDIVREHQP